jgi:hypothetical protein
MNKKIPLIGGDNIGLDRRQDNLNLQNGGNWGNRDFINQRQNGGFLDNIQNLDILNQGSGRFHLLSVEFSCSWVAQYLVLLSFLSFYQGHRYVLKKNI